MGHIRGSWGIIVGPIQHANRYIGTASIYRPDFDQGFAAEMAEASMEVG